MVSSPILTTSMRIPDAVYPPVPGESHRYYGNIHIKQVKLPQNNQSLRGVSSYPQYSSAENSAGNDANIHEATAAGNLARVKELLDPRGSGETTSSFLLANEASSSSGLTPLHYAASRGYLEIVKWLIDAAGAIVDLEDQTGETALLKASYNGHPHVVAFLLIKHAKFDQKDNDGWTALHNASSRGYLQIVKHLLEHTDAEVDVKSSKGHTPLMNAASKGHIDIVEYLLNRRGANPLVKNKLGEAAYDVAATSQEVYICELLEKAEREWWKGKRPLPLPSSFSDLVHLPAMNQPYDVYDFHITVPVILHENQRSSSVFGGLSSLRGTPKYSPNNLLKSDVRGPWSLHPSGKPSSKDDVQLPVEPSSSSMSVISNATSSKSSQKPWFWLTDWQIDITHPRVDPHGWQYARSFDEQDKLWLSAPPSGGGSWVRRRRWVRVMKRVTDLSDIGQNHVLQLVNNNDNENTDYVMKAESIIKKDQGGKIHNEPSAYREAIEILLNGIKTDTNPQRKQEATSLVTTFTQHADYLEKNLKGADTPAIPNSPSLHEIPITPNNIITPPPRPPTSINTDPSFTPKTQNVGVTSSHKPPPSIRSFETIENPWSNEVPSEDVGTQPSILDNLVSPVRVHPQTGLTITTVQAQASTTPGKWEDDSCVSECRRCRKKFGLWIRKHHCRKCGQVVCDQCSTARVSLPAAQVLTGPSKREDSSSHRVCDSCCDSIGYSRSNGTTSDRRRMSNSSTMTECPACNVPLNKTPEENQEHVKRCLENKKGSGIQGYKYVGEQGDF